MPKPNEYNVGLRDLVNADDKTIGVLNNIKVLIF